MWPSRRDVKLRAHPSLLRPAAWRVGLVAAAGAALVMAVVVRADGRDSLFRNDGELYWLVARDPFGDGSVFHTVAGFAEQYGVAYRFGRILYPLLAWTLVGGADGAAIEWSLMVVDVVSFGAATAVAAELCARRGLRPFHGLALLLVPAMWFSCVLALAEPLMLGLVLLVYLLVLDGRQRAAMVAGALLLLTRESALLALLPLVIAVWRRGDRSAIVGWMLVPVPLLLWWTWIRFHIGAWPFLDSSVSRREALDLPLVGVLDAMQEGLRPAHFVAFAVAVATVATVVWVARQWSWWPVTHGAVLFSLLLLFFGPNAWRHPGEAMRLMGPAQALVVLGMLAGPLATRLRMTRPSPGAATVPGRDRRL